MVFIGVCGIWIKLKVVVFKVILCVMVKVVMVWIRGLVLFINNNNFKINSRWLILIKICLIFNIIYNLMIFYLFGFFGIIVFVLLGCRSKV